MSTANAEWTAYFEGIHAKVLKMMKAMIFAAGLGTRLRPLTDRMPKALVPVAGEPLLRHVLDKLKSAGYDDITVNVHHFADMVEEDLACTEGLAPEPGAGVHISDERALLLDTGGAVSHARRYLEGSGHFLLHNVDILSDLDLSALEAACRPDDLATLVVSERESSRRLLFDDELRLRGWTNLRTGEIRSPYPDLDPSTCRSYAFSGIHLMSDRVFGLMGGGAFPVMDFYLENAASHSIRAYVAEGLRIIDVGKSDALALVESFR